jgi:hypothetical protein
MDDFDKLVETAVSLFERALEKSLTDGEFFRRWDALHADICRRWPGAHVPLLAMYASGLAMGRWEVCNGLLPENHPSPRRLQ